MAVFRDCYDQPVTTASQEALEHYVEGMRCQLMRNGGIEAALQRALEADPDFPLALAALSVPLQGAGKVTEARAAAERASALAGSTTPREQGHIAVIAAAAAGDAARGLELAQEHLQAYPRDATILSRRQFMLNTSGRRDRKEASLAQYEASAPQFGDDAWFLGSYAFQLNEMYRFAAARDCAERSFAFDQRNSDCSHSLAHCMFETGDHDGGAAFLSGWLDGSAWQQQMAGHLSWHLALFQLNRGDHDAAVATYERALAPSVYPGTVLQIALLDSASFLWRCELLGIEPPDGALSEVAAFATGKFPRTGQAFADSHRALAYALAGDTLATERLQSELQELLAGERLSAGPVLPALVEGVSAFAAGDYEGCLRCIEPYEDQFVRIGGSRAQYEVFQDTLIAAYLRTGRGEQASRLLAERLARRPSRRDEFWLQQASEAPPAAG